MSIIPVNDSFFVVSLYIFKETYILLESLFHTELNDHVPIPYIRISISYNSIIKYV